MQIATVLSCTNPFNPNRPAHPGIFNVPRSMSLLNIHKNAVRIATSDAFENQAFRYKANVYALQFHIEVTPEMIRGWFEKEEGHDVEAMVNIALDLFPEYKKRAFSFYEKFFN